MSNLGGYIRYLRKQEGWTLQQLGERLNLSVAYLSDIERGRAKNPTLDTIAKLAGAFGIQPLDLFGEAAKGLSADERSLIDAYRVGDTPTLLRMVALRMDIHKYEELPVGSISPQP